jgi:hypothetical protein
MDGVDCPKDCREIYLVEKELLRHSGIPARACIITTAGVVMVKASIIVGTIGYFTCDLGAKFVPIFPQHLLCDCG